MFEMAFPLRVSYNTGKRFLEDVPFAADSVFRSNSGHNTPKCNLRVEKLWFSPRVSIHMKFFDMLWNRIHVRLQMFDLVRRMYQYHPLNNQKVLNNFSLTNPNPLSKNYIVDNRFPISVKGSTLHPSSAISLSLNNNWILASSYNKSASSGLTHKFVCLIIVRNSSRKLIFPFSH